MLAYDLAILSLMADRVRRGRLTGAWFAKATLSRLASDLSEFLEARRAAGLDGSKEALKTYCESMLFDGFSLSDGRFLGSPEAAERVCGPWIRAFSERPTEDEAARFEVGALILMLSGCAQEIFARRAARITGETYEEWLSGSGEFPRSEGKEQKRKGFWAGIFRPEGRGFWARGKEKRKKKRSATGSSWSGREERERTS